MHLQLPFRCLPQDLINPFSQYRVPVTVCAVVLVVAAFFLGRTRRTTGGRTWVAQFAIVFVPALVALVVAGWVWLQSFLWLAPCGIAPFGSDWRFGLQEADQRIIPTIVNITLIFSVIAFVTEVALALTRLLSRGDRPAI